MHTGRECSSIFGDPAAEPRAWRCPPVSIAPVRQGDWVGKVSHGAAINFFDLHCNPHGNGTHTEGLGHISPEHQPLPRPFPKAMGILELLRLSPERNDRGEQILRHSAWPRLDHRELDAVALAVEGLPFPFDFSGQNAPFLEPQIMASLAEANISHFITNLPSVDPEEDGGALAAHRAFWSYPHTPRYRATITELAYFPPDLTPGNYFYHLQTPAFANDAVPCRLTLYPLELV